MTSSSAPHPSLFHDDPLPEGFVYAPEFISVQEEQALLDEIRGIAFSAVEMRGAMAKRRIAHFGWTYGYESRVTRPGLAIPGFLVPLRARAARWAQLEPDALAEALITEYPPAAPIGWHRDAPMFGDVLGISLAGACRMKFRPYVSPKEVGGPGRAARRTTHERVLEPRSIYLMRGVVRREFEHSIPPVETLRYSITFRTVRQKRTA